LFGAWREVRRGIESLASITDALSAMFVDMEEGGTLDVMVQRTGECSSCRTISITARFL